MFQTESVEEKKVGRFSERVKVFFASLFAAVSLVILGWLTGDNGVLGNLLIMGILIIVVPYFLSKYAHVMWLRSVEDHFPNFIRDLADSSRSGMTFKESLSIAKRSNYGKLTPEIERMYNRLTWGTPFINVLLLFEKKVAGSRIISDALDIIRESYLSGGNVSDSLDAVARDMIMLKEAESERSSMVGQQVMIMYGIFFMFLGIAVMVIMVMVPMLQQQPTGSGGLGSNSGLFGVGFANPCEGLPGFPCSVFYATATLFTETTGVAAYYTAMFFIIVVIQAIFTGLIAGQLGENSITAGSKHSIIMLISAIAIFVFLARTGILPL